jgi:hypothetical protein
VLYHFVTAQNANRLVDKVETLQGRNKTDIEFAYNAMKSVNAAASSMLRVNAIFLAVISFLYRDQSWLQTIIKNNPDLSLGIALCLIFSIFSCLYVISFEWGWLGQVSKINNTFDFTREITAVYKSLIQRTRIFIVSWILTTLAFSLGLALGFHAAEFSIWVACLMGAIGPALCLMNFGNHFLYR